MSKSQAVIEHSGDEKYILVQLLDDSQEAPETRDVLVSLPFSYHDMILDAFESRLPSTQRVQRVLGGGILTIDRESQRIQTYGQSGSFGKPPVELVERILEESFPDWSIDATVTDYIR